MSSLVDEIKKGENKKLEFKEKLPSNGTIAKTVIAFSNTSGGKLIIGIDDNKQILGNSDIKVAIYDDIVEITSAGGFPNGLILEEVMSGRSEIRNRVLAKLFRELHFVETWGSGIAKIKKVFKEQNIKFEINESGNFVTTVFYRPKIANSAEKPAKNQRKTSEKPANLTNQEEIIYNFLAQNSQIDLQTTQKLLNVKSARAREILSNLVKKSILEKIGKTKGSYYILKRDSNEK